MNGAVRIVFIVIGLIAVVVGGIFAAQGLGVLPGSFMTGDRTWLYVGLVLAVIGIILIAVGFRRPRRAVR